MAESQNQFRIVRIAMPAGLLAALCAFVGCHSDEKAPPAPERIATTRLIREQPYSTSVKPIAIQQGTLPLAWICQAASNVSIVDTTSGETIAASVVSPREIVRVDARHGVAVGSATLRAGPLPAEHRYAIMLIPDRTSVMRSTTVEPTQRQSPEQR